MPAPWRASPVSDPAAPAPPQLRAVRRALAIVLLTIAVAASWQLGRSSSNFAWWNTLIALSSSRWGAAALHDLATPHSGEYVLAPAVRESLELLRRRQVSAYALSPRIVGDEALMQRIVEAAFPRRTLRDAPYLLSLSREPLPPACRPLETAKDVELSACN